MDRCTFQNFVVNPANRFAWAAAKAVSDNPGRTYNPLYICGPQRSGKTHLLYAIRNHILSNNSKAKVLYVTAELFSGELIDSIRISTLYDLMAKYTGLDVLLLDDINYVTGNERVQKELFHIFNALFKSGKQIVLADDESSRIDRLISRFEWSQIIEIQGAEIEVKS